ncbi:hypothetical protein Golax_025903 [Gossypium laxum]|uniref:DUF7745 domain-containing protein n=1 Tax=Gossypium laxum TaxID=34288 RepID=A0A7J9B0Y5_9ROSI|nr:hypothetical protein [Gossypium laxum]
MEKGFLDKVEDNAAVRTWSETMQQEKGDSLADRQLFYNNYGDIPYLLDVKVDKHLFRALAQFWNHAYSCFTFGRVDLVPTIEEYAALLRCSKFETDKVYWKAMNVPTFLKKLMNITGMSEQWVTARIKQKGDSNLVVFPKALRHVDEAITDLFDRLDKRVTPILAILSFWKIDKVSYRVFSKNYSSLKEIVATSRRDDIAEEKWMTILQNLQEEDIEWKAPWLLPDEILYKCGNFNWTRRMKRLAVGPMITPEYNEWWVRRINDNTPKLSPKNNQSIEENLRIIPSELEIIKQDFERKNADLEKRIEQMEEEKMNLRLDIEGQKLENEKLKKGKHRVKEEVGSLKTDYKKLHLSMRTAGLGITSE